MCLQLFVPLAPNQIDFSGKNMLHTERECRAHLGETPTTRLVIFNSCQSKEDLLKAGMCDIYDHEERVWMLYLGRSAPLWQRIAMLYLEL